MRILSLFLVGVFLIAGLARAGEIHGKVTFEGKPVGKNLVIEITHPDRNKPYICYTNAESEYSVYVKENGKCTLRVLGSTNPPEATVFSRSNRSRYDLNIYRDTRKTYQVKVN